MSTTSPIASSSFSFSHPSPSIPLPRLLEAIKALFPVPTKSAVRSRAKPTRADLDQFLEQVPEAIEALTMYEGRGGRGGESWRDEEGKEGSSGPLSVEARELSWHMGLVGIWAARRIDTIVKEAERDSKPGDPPVLPLSAPQLILILLSHSITHVFRPLYLAAFPSSNSPVPPLPSSSTSRFTELPPDLPPPSSEDKDRIERAKETVGLALADVLRLGIDRPVTDVGRLVRDGGVVGSLLKMAVALGWDKGTELEAGQTLRTLVKDLLNSYHPSRSLALLSPLLQPSSTDLSRSAGRLMTDILMRPAGIEGLLQGIFGKELEGGTGREEGDVGKKAESVARILCSVPGGMRKEDYYPKIVPRLFDMLASPSTPAAYLRPISLSIVRLLPSQSHLILPSVHNAILSPDSSVSDPSDNHPAYLAISILLPLVLLSPPLSQSHDILLGPILPQLFGLHWHLQQSQTADTILRNEVEGVLRSWGRVGDEANVRAGLLRVVKAGRGWEGSAGGLLGPVGATGEGDEEGEWYWTGGGEDLRIAWGIPPPVSTTPTPSTQRTQTAESLETETLSLLSLHPPPNLLVAFAKSLDRPSIAGDLFVSLLTQLRNVTAGGDEDLDRQVERVGAINEDGGSDPKRQLLLTQIVLKMVDEMGENLVKGEETRILGFVHHALEVKKKGKRSAQEGRGEEGERLGGGGGVRLADLKIVDSDDESVGGEEEEEKEEDSDGLDSDDEVELPDRDDENMDGLFAEAGVDSTEGAKEPTGGGKLGIVGTAIGLLVAVLQSNDDLSPSTSPILVVIQSSLETHTHSHTPSIRHLAREARLLISVRQATSSFPPSSSPNPSSSFQPAVDALVQKYYEALRLVSDPLVPVRAHGLITLRHLVLPPSQPKRERPSSPSSSLLSETSAMAVLPPAFIPAILDVFLQSVQDPDTFVYLNAVKGLSALVDGWGKDVLGRMLAVYAKGVGSNGWDGGVIGAGEMERGDLDLRLRVGEALCGVVERSGAGLGVHASTLIPPLLLVFRSSTLPTALRSSALTILSIISSTSPLAINPYSTSLVLACADLLQTESVPLKQAHQQPKRKSSEEGDMNVDADEDEEDPSTQPEELNPTISPVLSNSKHPILRRAALHFLSAMLRGDMDASAVDRDVWKRVGIIVGYVGQTDEDLLTRGLAKDVSRDLRKIMRGHLGVA